MGIHIILFAGWINNMAKSKWFKWIAQLEIHSCWVFQGFRLKGKLEKSSEWFRPWNEVKRWPKKIWASLLALNGRLGLQHCLAIFSAAAVSYRTCSRGNAWAKNVHFGLDLNAIIWMYRHPPHLLPPNSYVVCSVHIEWNAQRANSSFDTRSLSCGPSLADEQWCSCCIQCTPPWIAFAMQPLGDGEDHTE